MLMVLAAEIDVSMSVRVFEELTFTKAESGGLFSVKMRSNYNVLTGLQTRRSIGSVHTSTSRPTSTPLKNHPGTNTASFGIKNLVENDC